jgi:glycosyltransferase involved in cell wall biosynthesis
MKILIDLQPCQSGSRLGGIGRYSLALAQAIARQAGEHELYILLSGLLPYGEAEIYDAFAGILPPERIKTCSLIGPIASLMNNPASQEISKLLREEFIRGLAPDIVHVSSIVEGLGDDVLAAIDDDFADRTVVTWYDLIPYVMPEQYLTDPVAAKYYYEKVELAKQSACLLAISEFTRQEAIELLQLAPNQVVNIRSAANSNFKVLDISANEAAHVRSTYGIDRPFLMYTGSFDLRKNQPALIQAFAKLPTAVRSRYQLVIVGNCSEQTYKQLHQLSADLGLPKNSVILTGRIDDDQLVKLYNLSHLLVYPSLSEGFGLPILEAMSCGAPAIGSNCASVPEVIGYEDALFDPRSVESICQKMLEVLTNETLRQKLADHAVVQCRKFSWDQSARTALAAFESVVRSRATVGKISPKRSESAYRTLIRRIGLICAKHKLSNNKIQEIANAIDRNERQIFENRSLVRRVG